MSTGIRINEIPRENILDGAQDLVHVYKRVGGTYKSFSAPLSAVAFQGPRGEDGLSGTNGIDGLSGNSVAQVVCYRRLPPSYTQSQANELKPGFSTNDDGSFDFTNKQFIPPIGWSGSVPPVGLGEEDWNLWASNGVASIVGNTGVDNTIVWSDPETSGIQGLPGHDGRSTYQAVIFTRAAVHPLAPKGGKFDFGSDTLITPTSANVIGTADEFRNPDNDNGNIWYVDVGGDLGPPGDDQLYMCNHQFAADGEFGVDTAGDWSAPTRFARDGADGVSTYYVSIYKRTSADISGVRPGAGDDSLGGYYDFRTEELVFPADSEFNNVGSQHSFNGWSEEVPEEEVLGQRTPLWMSSTLATGRGNYAIPSSVIRDNDLIWTEPKKVSQPAVDGNQGNAVTQLRAYIRSVGATPPSIATLSANSSFDFENKILDLQGSGWNTAPFKSPLTQGDTDYGYDFLYVSVGIASTQYDAVNDNYPDDNDIQWSDPLLAPEDGEAAVSTYLGQIYTRYAGNTNIQLASARPEGGSFDFTSNTLTVPSTDPTGELTWFANIPVGTGTIYVSQRNFAVLGNSGVDNWSSASPWSTPAPLAFDGVAGLDGITNARITLYYGSDDELVGNNIPDFPSDVHLTVNLDSSTTSFGDVTKSTSNGADLVITDNQVLSSNGQGLSAGTGWYTKLPSNDWIYATEALASDTDSTDSVLTDVISGNEWSDTVSYRKPGSNGLAGLATSVVSLYKRAGSPSIPSPAEPSGPVRFYLTSDPENNKVRGDLEAIQNDDGVLTDFNGWVKNPPSFTNSNDHYLWQINATASSRLCADVIQSSEWSTPSIFSQNPFDLTETTVSHVVQAYKRDSVTPTTNPGECTVALSGDLAGQITSTLGGGWTKTIPDGDQQVYIVHATAAGNVASITDTDTISANEWSTPAKWGIKGERGLRGEAGSINKIITLYKRTGRNVQVAEPEADGTYNFDTDTWTFESGHSETWTLDIPAHQVNDKLLWQTFADALCSQDSSVYSISATEWSEPKAVAEDGTTITPVYSSTVVGVSASLDQVYIDSNGVEQDHTHINFSDEYEAIDSNEILTKTSGGTVNANTLTFTKIKGEVGPTGTDGSSSVTIFSDVENPTIGTDNLSYLQVTGSGESLIERNFVAYVEFGPNETFQSKADLDLTDTNNQTFITNLDFVNIKGQRGVSITQVSRASDGEVTVSYSEGSPDTFTITDGASATFVSAARNDANQTVALTFRTGNSLVTESFDLSGGKSITNIETSLDSNGNTVVQLKGKIEGSNDPEENIGSTFTINKGPQGIASKVVVVYATDSDGSGATFTRTSGTDHVKYHEYTGSQPAESDFENNTGALSGGFVQFVGNPGSSVTPIFAEDSSGTNPSLTQTAAKTFVTFYEKPFGTVVDGNTDLAALISANNLTFVNIQAPARDAGLLAYPAFGSDDFNDIKFDSDENALVLHDSVDTTTGMAFPAISVEDAGVVEFDIAFKADISDDTGVYIRVYETEDELQPGKLAISVDRTSSGEPAPLALIQTQGVINTSSGSQGTFPVTGNTSLSGFSTKQGNDGENIGVTTTYVTSSFRYIPHPDAKWASLNILNWSGMGNKKLFVKPVIPRILGKNIETVTKVAGSETMTFTFNDGTSTDVTVPNGNDVTVTNVSRATTTDINDVNYGKVTMTFQVGTDAPFTRTFDTKGIGIGNVTATQQTDENGNSVTRISVADELGAEINTVDVPNGLPGANSHVAIVYADNADGLNPSYDSTGKTFIRYHEFTGDPVNDKPAASTFGGSGINQADGSFVQYVGVDGKSITPLYADVVNPTQVSQVQLTPDSQSKFVTFFERVGGITALNQLTNEDITSSTFVSYVGADGTSVSILGSRDSTNNLPSAASSTLGDGYIIGNDLYIYTGNDDNTDNGYENVGVIRGPQGIAGTAVTPVYATDSNGTGKTLVQTDSTTHVFFYVGETLTASNSATKLSALSPPPTYRSFEGPVGFDAISITSDAAGTSGRTRSYNITFSRDGSSVDSDTFTVEDGTSITSVSAVNRNNVTGETTITFENDAGDEITTPAFTINDGDGIDHIEETNVNIGGVPGRRIDIYRDSAPFIDPLPQGQAQNTPASTFTILNGDPINLVTVYANDTDGTGASYTQGTREFVRYHEYTNSAGTPAITDFRPGGSLAGGFVKFIGEDAEQITPIYASDANGTGASTTEQADSTHVNFFEGAISNISATTVTRASDQSTTLISALTFIKIKGEAGDKGIAGIFFNGFEPGEDFNAWTAAQPNHTITTSTDKYAGTQAALITSSVLDTDAAGNIGGVFAEVPENLALLFAGKEVEITIYAKKAATNGATSFRAAYSTNEVGNSQWRTFSDLTTNYKPFRFTYNIASPTSGGVDYIGIQGDGFGRGVLIDNVSIAIKAASLSSANKVGDTVTLTFSDGSSDTFDVVDGQDLTVTDVQKTGETVRLIFNNDSNNFREFNVPNGVGIGSVVADKPEGSTTTTITIRDDNDELLQQFFIQDGLPGAAANILVVFADNAAGLNPSTNPGTGATKKRFVKYHEYTGDAPTAATAAAGGGFVEYVGADGSPGSKITPLYATDADGANIALHNSPAGPNLPRTYVNFFEGSVDEIDGTNLKFNGQIVGTTNGMLFVNLKGQTGEEGPRGPVGSVPIFASNANGDNASLTQSSSTPFVFFYTGGAVASDTSQAGLKALGSNGDWTKISGDSLYLHVKYADKVLTSSDNASDMTDDPTGKKYIGLSYNNPTPTESTDPGSYTWSLIQAEALKPDGFQVVPAYSNNDNNTISFDSEKGELILSEHSGGSDIDFGMAWPAVNVDGYRAAGKTISGQLKIKASSSIGDNSHRNSGRTVTRVQPSMGVYFRAYEYNAELPAGKTTMSISTPHHPSVLYGDGVTQVYRTKRGREYYGDDVDTTGYFKESFAGWSTNNVNFLEHYDPHPNGAQYTEGDGTGSSVLTATEFVTIPFEYIPSPDAKYVAFNILNWNSNNLLGKTDIHDEDIDNRTNDEVVFDRGYIFSSDTDMTDPSDTINISDLRGTDRVALYVDYATDNDDDTSALIGYGGPSSRYPNGNTEHGRIYKPNPLRFYPGDFVRAYRDGVDYNGNPKTFVDYYGYDGPGNEASTSVANWSLRETTDKNLHTGPLTLTITGERGDAGTSSITRRLIEIFKRQSITRSAPPVTRNLFVLNTDSLVKANPLQNNSNSNYNVDLIDTTAQPYTGEDSMVLWHRTYPADSDGTPDNTITDSGWSFDETTGILKVRATRSASSGGFGSYFRIAKLKADTQYKISGEFRVVDRGDNGEAYVLVDMGDSPLDPTEAGNDTFRISSTSTTFQPFSAVGTITNSHFLRNNNAGGSLSVNNPFHYFIDLNILSSDPNGTISGEFRNILIEEVTDTGSGYTTYDISTGELTNLPSGWSPNPPNARAGSKIYRSTAPITYDADLETDDDAAVLIPDTGPKGWSEPRSWSQVAGRTAPTVSRIATYQYLDSNYTSSQNQGGAPTGGYYSFRKQALEPGNLGTQGIRQGWGSSITTSTDPITDIKQIMFSLTGKDRIEIEFWKELDTASELLWKSGPSWIVFQRTSTVDTDGTNTLVNVNVIDHSEDLEFIKDLPGFYTTSNAVAVDAVFGYTPSIQQRTLELFKRTTTLSAPAVPPGTLKYNFSTDGFTSGSLNNWFTSQGPSNPSTSDRYLWVTRATAVGTLNVATNIYEDQIPTSEWSTPSLIAQDGITGPTGDTFFNKFLYTRTAVSDPAFTGDNAWGNSSDYKPGALYVNTETYVDDQNNNTSETTGRVRTNSISSLTTGPQNAVLVWSEEIPPESNGQHLWVIVAPVVGTNLGTGQRPRAVEVGSNDWAEPVLLSKDGVGLNSATVRLYRRTDGTTPSTGSTGNLLGFVKGTSTYNAAQPPFEYNFSTGNLNTRGVQLGPNSNELWSTSLPNAGGNTLWVSRAIASSAGTKDDIGWSQWSAPEKLVTDGSGLQFIGSFVSRNAYIAHIDNAANGYAGIPPQNSFHIETGPDGRNVSYLYIGGENTTDKNNSAEGASFKQLTIDGVQGQTGRSFTFKGTAETRAAASLLIEAAYPGDNSPADGWVYRITGEAGANALYVYTHANDAWELLTTDGDDGADSTVEGPAGNSVFIIYSTKPLTVNNNAGPALPNNNYNFDNNSGAYPASGDKLWYTSAVPPAGKKYNWMSQKVAKQPNDANISWGAPIPISGKDGEAGFQTISLKIFKRAATRSDLGGDYPPSGTTSGAGAYDFANKRLLVPDGWSSTIRNAGEDNDTTNPSDPTDGVGYEWSAANGSRTNSNTWDVVAVDNENQLSKRLWSSEAVATIQVGTGATIDSSIFWTKPHPEELNGIDLLEDSVDADKVFGAVKNGGGVAKIVAQDRQDPPQLLTQAAYDALADVNSNARATYGWRSSLSEGGIDTVQEDTLYLIF